MGSGFWSWSTCRPDVQWYGVPGQGAWYWTARFGQYWVGGAVYQWYSWNGWECGNLGPPVKAYGPISEFGGGEGVWFQGGCIIYKYTTANWATYVGNFGQTAGRLAEGELDDPATAEPVPGCPPGVDWTVLEPMPKPPRRPRAPRVTR